MPAAGEATEAVWSLPKPEAEHTLIRVQGLVGKTSQLGLRQEGHFRRSRGMNNLLSIYRRFPVLPCLARSAL